MKLGTEVVKRTYVLPAERVKQFEAEIEPGRRSAFIARLIEDWLERRRKAELRAAIIEGCRDMTDIVRETSLEHHALEEEVERASPARGRRSRSS